MVAWTALAFGLTFTMSMPPILANRALLGLFESTFNPCLVTIMVQWYLKAEQPFVSAVWHSFTSLSTCIQSIMGFGFYYVRENSALKSWQYLLLTASCISAIATSELVVGKSVLFADMLQSPSSCSSPTRPPTLDGPTTSSRPSLLSVYDPTIRA